MLTLYLLRHAKSDWSGSVQNDFDRPLNKRGARDAEELGRYFQHKNIHPQRVLLSPSRRTCETFRHLAAHVSPQPDFITLRRLYGAGAAEILTRIQKYAGDATPLLVIAHNPGIGELVRYLTRDDPTNALDVIRSKYPTSGLATLTFDSASWTELTPQSGTLVDFTSPRLRRSD